MNVKNIVAFIILMGNKKGNELYPILSKSPDYIMEKFQRYCLSEKDDEFLWGLDSRNEYVMQEWRSKWDKEYKAMQEIKK